jgi:hypothetical protein
VATPDRPRGATDDHASRPRKVALTAHLASSVGWLGAAACFLALAVVGLTSKDAQTARATSLVMAPAAWSVLVPLSLGSLLTGLVLSLGTTWGLLRHYWVLIKLLITGLARSGDKDGRFSAAQTLSSFLTKRS